MQLIRHLESLFKLFLAYVAIGPLHAEASPPALGLYDGAIAIERNDLVDKSLQRTNTGDLENPTLREVVARIENMTGLQVWVDIPAFEETRSPFDFDSKPTDWYEGESIAQWMARFSQQIDQDVAPTWIVEGRVATLTTRERSSWKYVTRQYRISPALQKQTTLGELVLALEDCTTGPWDADEPGTGTLSYVGGVLIVRQTYSMQQEVAQVLAGLERTEPIVLLGCSPKEFELRKLLEEKTVSFDWQNLTLQDFGMLLEEMTGARIRLDVRVLTDAGLTPDTTLSSARAVELPLQQAIQQCIAEVDGNALQMHIDHDDCWVTTAEKVNELYETVIYRVGSLGMTGDRQARFIATLQSETSGPWDSTEPGTGTIQPIGTQGVLLVRQTQPVHRQIMTMIRDLRELQMARSPTVAQEAELPITVATTVSEPRGASAMLPATSLAATPDPPSTTSHVGQEVQFSVPLLLALLTGAVVGFIGRKAKPSG